LNTPLYEAFMPYVMPTSVNHCMSYTVLPRNLLMATTCHHEIPITYAHGVYCRAAFMPCQAQMYTYGIDQGLLSHVTIM